MRDITRPEVWAPDAGMVEVVVDDTETIMARSDGGWWWSEPLPPGTLYQFRIDGGMLLPDPRSLSQPDGPHGPSRIVDPALFDRPATFSADLRGAVGYELHIGTFTPEGTFEAAITHLDHLVDLGVQAVEVMPVADFPGEQGWGYDGVGQYAVHAAYGGPEGFVAFIDACHARGLGVILDVVHNHQGPEGNYLAQFGPYFTSAHHTPWGDAINLDQPGSSEVRDFLLGACRQWLVKYQVDGLRLDAVHEFQDDSPRHYLAELSDEARVWERETGREFTLFAALTNFLGSQLCLHIQGRKVRIRLSGLFGFLSLLRFTGTRGAGSLCGYLLALTLFGLFSLRGRSFFGLFALFLSVGLIAFSHHASALVRRHSLNQIRLLQTQVPFNAQLLG